MGPGSDAESRQGESRWRSRRSAVLALLVTALVAVVGPGQASASNGDGDQQRAERQRIEAGIGVILRYAENRAPELFAGAYIDEGGLVQVGFTNGAERHLRALRQEFPLPERLRAFEARRGEAELNRLVKQISGDIPTLVEQGIDVRTVGVDVKRNRVTVGVMGLSPSEPRSLAARYGEAVVARGVRAVRRASRGNSYPPLKGGLTIDSPQGLTSYRCTSAFVAQSGSTYSLLTAGHCGPVNSGWLHNVFFIGTMTRNVFYNGSSADAGRIQIRSTDRSNLVFISNSNMRPIRGTNFADVVGGSICMSANSSGYVCGSIADTNETIRYADGVTLYNQRLSSFGTIAGDSGGPIFSGNTAHGVVSGYVQYSNGDRDGIYSHVSHVQSQLGVSITTCCS